MLEADGGLFRVVDGRREWVAEPPQSVWEEVERLTERGEGGTRGTARERAGS